MNTFPNIDDNFNVEKEKINFFWKNGFVILNNVLSRKEIEISGKK